MVRPVPPSSQPPPQPPAPAPIQAPGAAPAMENRLPDTNGNFRQPPKQKTPPQPGAQLATEPRLSASDLAERFDISAWFRDERNAPARQPINNLADAFAAAVIGDGTDEDALTNALWQLCLLCYRFTAYVATDLANAAGLSSQEQQQLANLLRPSIDMTVQTHFADRVACKTDIKAEPDYQSYFDQNPERRNPLDLIPLIIESELGLADNFKRKQALALIERGSAAVQPDGERLVVKLPDVVVHGQLFIWESVARNLDCSEDPRTCTRNMVVAAAVPPSLLVFGAMGVRSGANRMEAGLQATESPDDVVNTTGYLNAGQGTSGIVLSTFSMAKGAKALETATEIPTNQALPVRLHSDWRQPAQTPPVVSPPRALPGEVTEPLAQPTGQPSRTAPFASGPVYARDFYNGVVFEVVGPSESFSAADTSPPPTTATAVRAATWWEEANAPQDTAALPVLSGNLPPATPSPSALSPDGAPPTALGIDLIAYAGAVRALGQDPAYDRNPDDDLPLDAYLGPALPENHAQAGATPSFHIKDELPPEAMEMANRHQASRATRTSQAGTNHQNALRAPTINIVTVTFNSAEQLAFEAALNAATGSDVLYLQIDTPAGAIFNKASKTTFNQTMLNLASSINALQLVAQKYPGRNAVMRIKISGVSAIDIQMTLQNGNLTFVITVLDSQTSAEQLAFCLGFIVEFINREFYPTTTLNALFSMGTLFVSTQNTKSAQDALLKSLNQTMQRFRRIDNDNPLDAQIKKELADLYEAVINALDNGSSNFN